MKKLIFWFIFLILASPVFILVKIVYAGTLSCLVTTKASCNSSGGVTILRMSGPTNAHAELPSQSTAAYNNNVVCCSGVSGLGYSCSGSYATVLNLTAVTNSHASQSATSPYTTPACISVSSGPTPQAGYIAGNQDCSVDGGYDTTLASVTASTNSHVGNTTAYTGAGNYKICATAGYSSSIVIRAQNYTTSVSTITFPQAAPGATVSQPYNNADGSGSPQTFGGAGTAKPVVTLFNGSSNTLKIWYNISTFTNDIVISENYLVNNKGAACTSASCITNAVTFDTNTDTGTTIAVGAGNEKDFYLKITLSSITAKSGNSTLTILGEAQ